MLVRTFPALEFGIVLNGYLRKVSPIQTLSITWISMLQHMNMLQPWQAAILCPFGGLDQFPSIESLAKNGKDRTLQAIELESGIGNQWHLWKWVSYCASERLSEKGDGKYETAVYAAQCSNLKRILPICTNWESACWAMAESWLDIQVDLELARLRPGGTDQFKKIMEILLMVVLEKVTMSLSLLLDQKIGHSKS